MTIVLRGLGLDIDSESSVVAFGLTTDHGPQPPTQEALENLSIENWYAIDYGNPCGRRPLTLRDWNRLCKCLKRRRLMMAKHVCEEERMAKQARRFDAMLPPQMRAARAQARKLAAMTDAAPN